MIRPGIIGDKKNLFLNDRHEEADTHMEDRRKLYDKRILPLLEENDFAVFGDKIDALVWNYYKNFGLATIKPENIFYVKNYLKFLSLTKAILADKKLIEKLKEKKFDYAIPYIESYDTGILAKKIGAKLLRPADFTELVNNKINYRKVLGELGLPIITGFLVKPENAGEYFKKLKEGGFKKVILKRPRSVSGFGTFVMESKAFLCQTLKDNFRPEENFVMEGFIENIEHSPNFQYSITADEIIFITATDQILEKDGVSYSGNIYPSVVSAMPDILGKIEEMSRTICLYLQKNKCFGMVGIDYIVTSDGDVYSPEANVRFNGSTFPALISQKLFGENPDIHWIFKTFHFEPISFKNLFDRSGCFLKPEEKNGIFPVGVDLLESMGEGQFMIIAQDSEEMYNLYKKFQNYR